MKNDRWKQRITIYSFIFCIVGIILVLVIFPKETISVSERRHLADKPKLTVKSLIDKSFMGDLEDYMLDHFPMRDGLRRIKAYFAYDVLGQKENNGIYVANGHASKLEYPLNEKSVKRLADKMCELKIKYFADNETKYAIVPDKNFFLASANGYPSIDYDLMSNLLSRKLSENGSQFEYIDIIKELEIDDYYKTDTHWRQEKIFDIAENICKSFGTEKYLKLDDNQYETHEIKEFYGVYYGQAALPMESDSIIYMTNEAVNQAVVWSLEDNMSSGNVTMPDDDNAVLKPVYRTDKLDDEKSLDRYDIFLGGAAALQIIKSPAAATDKRLIIFRDSYTSSLAPLFVEAYNEIVLIDLRYIDSKLIGQYVDFDRADILFLYNTLLINNSGMLK